VRCMNVACKTWMPDCKRVRWRMDPQMPPLCVASIGVCQGCMSGDRARSWGTRCSSISTGNNQAYIHAVTTSVARCRFVRQQRTACSLASAQNCVGPPKDFVPCAACTVAQFAPHALGTFVITMYVVCCQGCVSIAHVVPVIEYVLVFHCNNWTISNFPGAGALRPAPLAPVCIER
jgi:hypothetical protein